jgi:signal transduction histidine kinase
VLISSDDDTARRAAYRLAVTTHQPPFFPARPFFRSRFALPAVVAVVQIIGTLAAADHEPARRDLDALGVALLLAGPVALTVRSKHPVRVLLFVFGVTSAYELLGYVDGPIFVSLAVAVVAAIMHGHRTAAVAVVALGYVGFVWGEYLAGLEDAPELPEAIAVGAWLVALLTVPEVIRVRRERFAEAMRSRTEERRRRASEERLRIAQELHDVLAHHISLINVQAGSALHLLDQRPEQARPALAAIKDASNDALRELRSVLDLLREGGDGAPRSPTTGLAQLDGLIARTESAGLLVDKRIEGEPRNLPAAVDRAAFRIVQESLTNVTKHAGANAVAVSLAYEPTDLVIEVNDDGRKRSSSDQSGGKGIAGMRERALAVGGELAAGPRPTGGFRVRARLPYHAAPRDEAP